MGHGHLDIGQLMKLSEQAREQMELQMELLDRSFAELPKNLSSEEADQVDRLRALTQRAIGLAKQGRANEAQELIKGYRYGRKGHK